MTIAADTEHKLTRRGREMRVRVLELEDTVDGGNLLVFGHVTNGCLVRIHSRCLYGDALRSDDCDCGPELDAAMNMIQDSCDTGGGGVLVYLEQEGRGAGLIRKAKGLRHSELFGIDTFGSYEALAYHPDSRSYKVAAKALVALGLRSICLLTNNPDKITEVESAGITVARVPLITEARSDRARAYLDAKRRIRGHFLPDPGSTFVESIISEPVPSSVDHQMA